MHNNRKQVCTHVHILLQPILNKNQTLTFIVAISDTFKLFVNDPYYEHRVVFNDMKARSIGHEESNIIDSNISCALATLSLISTFTIAICTACCSLKLIRPSNAAPNLVTVSSLYSRKGHKNVK